MSRTKPEHPENSGRGRPIQLPAWWLAELRRMCGDESNAVIAERLNAAVERQPPFRRESVGDFLLGKVTTDVMMGAFVVLFPTLPPPIFFASSLEEARLFEQLSRLHAQVRSRTSDDVKVEETIEDTSAKRTKERKQRTRDRAMKRAK